MRCSGYRINDPEENDLFVIDLDFELVIGLVGRSGEVQHVPGEADLVISAPMATRREVNPQPEVHRSVEARPPGVS